ncbi:MAG: hypothetical protein WDN50_04300 [Bradyrhizobium sp.]
MMMTNIKALSVALVLSAAFAAPALARDAGTSWSHSYRRAHHEANFRGAYDGPLRALQQGDLSRNGGWRDPSCFNGGNGN